MSPGTTNISTTMLLPVFLLSACARTSPYVDDRGLPMVDPHVVAKPTQATLCIYRPFAFGSGLASPLITLDREPTLVLHNAGYTRVIVEPGKHSLATVHSGQWVKGTVSALDLEIQPGETYYIVVISETKTKYFIFGDATNFTFNVMPAEMAQSELQQLQYLSPLDRAVRSQ